MIEVMIRILQRGEKDASVFIELNELQMSKLLFTLQQTTFEEDDCDPPS